MGKLLDFLGITSIRILVVLFVVVLMVVWHPKFAEARELGHARTDHLIPKWPYNEKNDPAFIIPPAQHQKEQPLDEENVAGLLSNKEKLVYDDPRYQECCSNCTKVKRPVYCTFEMTFLNCCHFLCAKQLLPDLKRIEKDGVW